MFRWCVYEGWWRWGWGRWKKNKNKNNKKHKKAIVSSWLTKKKTDRHNSLFIFKPSQSSMYELYTLWVAYIFSPCSSTADAFLWSTYTTFYLILSFNFLLIDKKIMGSQPFQEDKTRFTKYVQCGESHSLTHTHTHTHTPAIPCRSSGNVIKTTNYWDVLQPRCGRRSTMGNVWKAIAFQGVEIPGRKRRIISSQVEIWGGNWRRQRAVANEDLSVLQSHVSTENEEEPAETHTHPPETT